MKHRLLLGITLVLAGLLAGCGPAESLFPLFNGNDRTFDPALVGEWKMKVDPGDEPKNTSRWVFQASKFAGLYDFSLTFNSSDKDEPSICSTARLVRLDDYLFVDFGPCAADVRKLGAMPFPVLEIHMFGRIKIEKDLVHMDFLQDDWVSAQVKAVKQPFAYVYTADGPVLSGKTEELRKLVLAHAKDDEAFTKTFTLLRLK